MADLVEMYLTQYQALRHARATGNDQAEDAAYDEMDDLWHAMSAGDRHRAESQARLIRDAQQTRHVMIVVSESASRAFDFRTQVLVTNAISVLKPSDMIADVRGQLSFDHPLPRLNLSSAVVSA